MADSPWRYSASARRFRDSRSGRFISAQAAVDIRDGFQDRRRADVDALAKRLADQDISVQGFERDMLQAIRELHTAQYVLGAGGLNAMTDEGWAAADALVEAQRAYLRSFAEDIAAGKLSEAQIGTRAKLYYGASRMAYEQGRASAFNVQLPVYPGQGSPCQANCACFWSLVEKPETVEATWQTTASESCRVCKQRARQYAPLVIAKASDGRIARLWRAVA